MNSKRQVKEQLFHLVQIDVLLRDFSRADWSRAVVDQSTAEMTWWWRICVFLFLSRAIFWQTSTEVYVKTFNVMLKNKSRKKFYGLYSYRP